MSKVFKTLDEAEKYYNKNQKNREVSEGFSPKEILEWKIINGVKRPHKALAKDGTEVYYIRNINGGLVDVGIVDLNEDGSFATKKVARKVFRGERVLHKGIDRETLSKKGKKIYDANPDKHQNGDMRIILEEGKNSMEVTNEIDVKKSYIDADN